MSKKGDSPSKKSPIKKLGDAFRRSLQSLSTVEKLSEVVELQTQESLAKRLGQDLQKTETSDEKRSEKTSEARCEEGAKLKDSSTSGKSSEKSAKPLVEAKSEDSATVKTSGKSEESAKQPAFKESEDSVLTISEGVVTMTLGSGKPDPKEEVKPKETEDGQDPEAVSTPKQGDEEIITSPPRRNPETLGATGGVDSKDSEKHQPKAFAELQAVPKIFKDAQPIETASDLKRACIEMYKFQGMFTDIQESVEGEINKTAPQLKKAVSNALSILTKITQFQQKSPRPQDEQAFKMQNDKMKLLINRSATVFQELEDAVGKYRLKILNMMDETCNSNVEMDKKLAKIVSILCDNRAGELEEEPDVKFQEEEE